MTNSNHSLWKLTASELSKGIRTKAYSCREVVQSCLDRVEEVNSEFNAVVSLQAADALAAADAADKAVAQGDDLGSLHGIPVTTKVNVDQKGLPTTNGVVAFKDLVAPSDNPVISNLRKAGAIIIGRTNTPAFSMRWFTDNDLHGRTLNPWRKDRTPGGSSGGAAVSVATAMCPIAHGNDGGGSIRYPAFCTGTVGLRPSFGRIPSYNETATVERPLSLQMISVQGPIARSVADVRLALEAMSAYDPRDPWWVPAPLTGPKPRRPMKVAACIDAGAIEVTDDISRAVKDSASVLAECGYGIDWVGPPDVVQVAHLWNEFAQGEARATILPVLEKFGDQLARRSMELMLARTPVHTPADRTSINASRSTWLRKWTLFMEEYPLILCPVAMEPALPYGVDTEPAKT